MPLVDHPTGHYRFLPGIAPYSCGVVSSPGYEIAHVTLHTPVPWQAGLDLARQTVAAADQPLAGLCAIELRSPRPFTFAGFAAFNAEYAAVLESWGLFVDGVNPVARTNVAPAVLPPAAPVLYGFSYTRPCAASQPPTFIVAGAGELPEGKLAHPDIVRVGDTSPDAIAEKAGFVMGLMEARLQGLGAEWNRVTAIDIYTIHSLDRVLPEQVLAKVGPAAAHGVRWFYTRPPIEAIEYEMDVRGVTSELRI